MKSGAIQGPQHKPEIITAVTRAIFSGDQFTEDVTPTPKPYQQ